LHRTAYVVGGRGSWADNEPEDVPSAAQRCGNKRAADERRNHPQSAR